MPQPLQNVPPLQLQGIKSCKPGSSNFKDAVAHGFGEMQTYILREHASMQAKVNELRSENRHLSIQLEQARLSLDFSCERLQATCLKGHRLEALGTTLDNGWACDARHLPDGCKSGITCFGQSYGVKRYRCAACDYDLCHKCVDARQAGARTQDWCCPAGHSLIDFQTTEKSCACIVCQKMIPEFTAFHGCIVCSYDVCRDCLPTLKAPSCASQVRYVSQQEDEPSTIPKKGSTRSLVSRSLGCQSFASSTASYEMMVVDTDCIEKRWTKLVQSAMTPLSRVEIASSVLPIKMHQVWMKALKTFRGDESATKEFWDKAYQPPDSPSRNVGDDFAIRAVNSTASHDLVERGSSGNRIGKDAACPARMCSACISLLTRWQRRKGEQRNKHLWNAGEELSVSEPRHGCTIAPASGRYFLWMIISLMVLCYEFFMIPLTVIFDLDDVDPCEKVCKARYLGNLVTCSFWTVDMVVTLRTAVFIHGRLVYHWYTILCWYAKTWLLFDLTLVLAEWAMLVVSLIYDWDYAPSEKPSKLLRALRVFLLLRAMRMSFKVREIIKQRRQENFEAGEVSQDERQWVCSRFIESYRVGPELARRARKCIADSQKRLSIANQMQQDAELLASLPADLRCALYQHAWFPIIFSSRVARSLYLVNPRIMRSLSLHAMSEVLALKGDTIFFAGDPCSGMTFVKSGLLKYLFEVYTPSSLPRSVGRHNWDSVCIMVKEIPKTSLVRRGDFLSEAVLWANKWEHRGNSVALVDSMMLKIEAEEFRRVVSRLRETTALAVYHAKMFMANMKQPGTVINDLLSSEEISIVEEDEERSAKWHFTFLSHYKVEAGTEATLMHEALERLVREDHDHIVVDHHWYHNPIFLDSADLKDLRELREHVQKSHSLVLLLTPEVLTRPWCIIEIVTASWSGVKIVPVIIERPGIKFAYPDDRFWQRLRGGQMFDGDTMDMIEKEGIKLDDIDNAFQGVFKNIALPFSPHKSANIREAELVNILKRCAGGVKGSAGNGVFSYASTSQMMNELPYSSFHAASEP